MLSLLSSGTLQLSDEVTNLRQDAHRLISEKTQVLDLMARRKRKFHQHMLTVAAMHSGREDFLLMRTAFLGMLGCRTHVQVHRRKTDKATSGKRSAWLWLWKKKLLCLWRRVVLTSCREEMAAAHATEVSACRAEISELQKAVQVSEGTISNVEKLLRAEKERVASLEAALAQSQAQVKEQQATLKEAYVHQFEEVQLRQGVEQRLSSVIFDVSNVRNERNTLQTTLEQKCKEIADHEELHQLRDVRLHEASGELSLAEVVIDDITSTKCVGTKRFFERYNLPGVLVSLFRKTIELKSLQRDGSVTRRLSVSSTGSAPASPGASPSSKKSASASLAADVRSALGLQKNCNFSKRALHTYVESLHLTQVSTAMTTQVLLALLGLNLGDGPCDVSRFVAALASPPAWEDSELAAALFGQLGEPAASIVSLSRNRSRGRAKTETSPLANRRPQRALTSPNMASDRPQRASTSPNIGS